VGGRRLAFEDVGAGEPVVLLHSGGLSGRQWRRLRDLLSPDRRVIVPDLLGYGASSPWPVGEPFAMEQDLEALRALLDHAGGPAHLVGHSYGGLLALKLAIERPAAARSLALYEPVAFGLLDRAADADAWALLEAIPLAYDATGPGGVDEAWLSSFVGWWNGSGAWASLGAEAKAGFRATGWKVFSEVSSLMADRTPREAYAAVTAPALLMGGERSPMPAGRVLERLAAALPRATRHGFPGFGHMAPVSHAAAVNEAIAAHVARASAG
jgi:pimeloyl-ACP methyl ester carboxylesterase